MSPALEKVLAGSVNAGDPIKLDMDALWRKSFKRGPANRSKTQRGSTDSHGDMGEFAVISAWARGKGKKG